MAKGQISHKKTDAVVRKLVAAIEWGCSAKYAYTYANISNDTYYRRLREDENFRAKIGEAQAKRMACVHNKKGALINEKYRPAIQQELKAKEPEVYGDKQQIHIGGQVEVQHIEIPHNGRDPIPVESEILEWMEYALEKNEDEVEKK